MDGLAAAVPRFEPRDPDYERRIRESFARQGFMATLGIEILKIAPGAVDLVLPHAPGLTQQHGYFHAGTSTTLADTAAGYAAFSLFPPGTGVLTSEFKVNLLNPGQGARLIAEGRVVKPGRRLTICRADVYGERDGKPVHVLTGLFTLVCMENLTG